MHETWLLILEGHAQFGLMNAFAGEAMFLENERTGIRVGTNGLKALVAYVPAEPVPALIEVVKGAFEASVRLSTAEAPSFPGSDGFIPAAKRRHDFDPSAPSSVHRQLAPAPLRDCNLHDRS